MNNYNNPILPEIHEYPPDETFIYINYFCTGFVIFYATMMIIGCLIDDNPPY
jgi:hypothetical protein